jgi:hypothetical protein
MCRSLEYVAVRKRLVMWAIGLHRTNNQFGYMVIRISQGLVVFGSFL